MENILSVFDGMSCLQIAFRELGYSDFNYFASEIDKFAIEQTQLNFPNTTQLGSIVDVDVSKLPKIDFYGGGSPCQSFSFAGKRKGMATKSNIEILTLDHYLELKEQDFEFEGQSYLFWEYVRVLRDIQKVNPDVKFLLENVEMSKKWERVLSEALGLYGVHINSSRVSAQNRKRIYWTNIRTIKNGLFGEEHSDIPQPKDKSVFLKDVLQSENDIDNKFYIKNPKAKFNGLDINGKGNTLRTSGHQSQSNKHNFDIIKLDKQLNVKPNQDKASCFTAGGNSGGNSGGNHSDMDIICVAMRGRDPENSSNRTVGAPTKQRLEPKTDGKTNCLTSVSKDNLILENKTEDYRLRRLTPTECSRLQTIPDWYIFGCSDTQAYKMLGNGWTVEVIKHILTFI